MDEFWITFIIVVVIAIVGFGYMSYVFFVKIDKDIEKQNKRLDEEYQIKLAEWKKLKKKKYDNGVPIPKPVRMQITKYGW
jgi:Tfp pilus assembly protein PilO